MDVVPLLADADLRRQFRLLEGVVAFLEVGPKRQPLAFRVTLHVAIRHAEREHVDLHAILAGLEPHVDIPDAFRRVVMRNPGGDALDAVIAAVGARRAVASADHAAIAAHLRYRREGHMYV